jgi:hypothetical protein
MEIIERVWLRMPANGDWSYFHCPAAAVDDWIQLGWQLSDPPPEPISPVVAENLAAAEAAAAEAELLAEPLFSAPLADSSPTHESARRGDETEE